MTKVSAVPTCRRRAASGTGSLLPVLRLRSSNVITVPLDPKNPHSRPAGSPIYIFPHARAYRRKRRSKPSSTESEVRPTLFDKSACGQTFYLRDPAS